jgi:hypothetical protein
VLKPQLRRIRELAKILNWFIDKKAASKNWARA